MIHRCKCYVFNSEQLSLIESAVGQALRLEPGKTCGSIFILKLAKTKGRLKLKFENFCFILNILFSSNGEATTTSGN